jgi:hypothetical protein
MTVPGWHPAINRSVTPTVIAANPARLNLTFAFFIYSILFT